MLPVRVEINTREVVEGDKTHSVSCWCTDYVEVRCGFLWSVKRREYRLNRYWAAVSPSGGVVLWSTASWSWVSPERAERIKAVLSRYDHTPIDCTPRGGF